MAVEWRGESLPSLDTQAWGLLSLAAGGTGDCGRDYLVKALFGEDGYHVIVSDTSCVWEEIVDSEKILDRLKSLNPNMEVSLPILQNLLSTHLKCRQPHATYTLTPSPPSHSPLDTPPTDTPTTSQITLSIQTTLSSLPLQWKFTLKMCCHKKLSAHLVLPLLSMVGELKRRQQELYKILSDKDKEIQDYKDQGHKVTRRYLETAPFITKTFENRMISSEAFEQTAIDYMQIFSDSFCQQLYKDVSLLKKWVTNKDTLPPMDGSGLESTATAGEAKISASLLPSIPSSLPHASPEKRPTHDPNESPSKENEQLRREELEKKLEKERNKAKRKKKRLM